LRSRRAVVLLAPVPTSTRASPPAAGDPSPPSRAALARTRSGSWLAAWSGSCSSWSSSVAGSWMWSSATS